MRLLWCLDITQGASLAYSYWFLWRKACGNCAGSCLQGFFIELRTLHYRFSRRTPQHFIHLQLDGDNGNENLFLHTNTDSYCSSVQTISKLCSVNPVQYVSKLQTSKTTNLSFPSL